MIKRRNKPETPRRRKRGSRGALIVVIAMLLGSGVLRLASGAGDVFAEEGIFEETVHDKPDDDSASNSCTPPPDIAAVLAALDQRETRLAAREAALADRLAALSLAEEEIAKNLIALEEAEARLSQLVALSETASETDLGRLTAVYEAMKPKEAAELFEEMSPEFAAGFLGRMRPENAAAILAGLTPEKAYTVSVILAGRNATAPTD